MLIYRDIFITRPSVAATFSQAPASQFLQATWTVAPGSSISFPSLFEGHTKRPRLSLLLNRPDAYPWPSSYQITLIRSPRRPRKINKWPEYGSCPRTFPASDDKPAKPLRMSVTPAHNQIFVCDGTGIIHKDHGLNGQRHQNQRCR